MAILIPRWEKHSGKRSVESLFIAEAERGASYSFPFLYGSTEETTAATQLNLEGATPEIIEGEQGFARRFNTSGNEGHFSSSSLTLEGYSQATVLAMFSNRDWIGADQDWSAIAGERVAGGDGAFYMGKVDGVAAIRGGFLTSSASGDFQHPTTPSNNQIYTLLMSWDGSIVRYTLDGEPVVDANTLNGGTLEATTDRFRIGRARNNESWRGDIYGLWLFPRGIVGTEAEDASGDAYGYMYKPRRKIFAIPSGATDTTAPILSSPTGTKTGSATASGTVSTDEANGTLYYLASENASETAATIKTGSSQTVTATGVQNVSFTGLTASTLYYAHYVHDDAASNESNVQASASFTTDAASSVIAIFRRRIEGQGNAFR